MNNGQKKRRHWHHKKHTKLPKSLNKFNAGKQILARVITKQTYSHWIIQKKRFN